MYTKQLIQIISEDETRSVPELVLKNGNVIDVFSGLIIHADVAINEGKIIGIGTYSGQTEVDCNNKFISPGFIDPCCRIDTTFLNITQFTAHYIKSGVTTLVVDNQKISTTFGKKTKEFFKLNSFKQAGQVFGLIPISLPNNKVEKPKYKSNYSFLHSMNKYPEFIGFGNFYKINELEEFNYKKLISDSLKPSFGIYHNNSQDELNFIRILGLQCLLNSNANSDFTNILQYGYYLCIQYNNGSNSYIEQLNKIKTLKINSDHICFCSGRLLFNNFFNFEGIKTMIAKAIELGIDPIQAIKMGSYNTAQLLKLDNLGAIAPGYQADLVVIDDINRFSIEQVYVKGKLIETNNYASTRLDNESIIKLTKKISVSNEWMERKLITKYAKKEFKAVEYVDGMPKITPLYNSSSLDFTEFNKIVVLSRYKKIFPKAYFGLIKYLNLDNAAIGFSVSNNVNNIVIIGSDNKNIMTVFNELKKFNGGIVISNSNNITASIKLPIGGILSNSTAVEFSLEYNKLLAELAKVTSNKFKNSENLWLDLFNLTNINTGNYRFTTKKIYDVKNYKYVN